jgi:hypothetical protein
LLSPLSAFGPPNHQDVIKSKANKSPAKVINRSVVASQSPQQRRIHTVNPRTLMHLSDSSIEAIERQQTLENIEQAEEGLFQGKKTKQVSIIKAMSIISSEKEQEKLETKSDLKPTTFYKV